MCGGGDTPQAEEPTPPPTQNLVPVETTDGTEPHRRRVKRLNAKGQQSGGATLLTGGIE